MFESPDAPLLMAYPLGLMARWARDGDFLRVDRRAVKGGLYRDLILAGA